MRSRIKALLCVAVTVVTLAGPWAAHTADTKDRPAAPPHKTPPGVFDHRHGHDRYYPPRGLSVRELPHDANATRWRGSTYYFHAGVWYRPLRQRWVVVTPPRGLVIAALPPFYTTIWVAGTPYYYANDIYYAWRPTMGGYVVVERPRPDAAISTQDATSHLYVYPKHGQSAEQQATDRYECHRWAVNETGFDPVQPLASTSAARLAEQRDAYARALTACLQGRGYSVK